MAYGCLGIILLLLVSSMISASLGLSEGGAIVIFFGIIVFAIFTLIQQAKKEEEKKKEEEEQEKIKKEEKEKFIIQVLQDNNIPEDHKVIFYKRGHPFFKKKDFDMIMWKDEENLYFVDISFEDDMIDRIEIPLKDIEYYATRGEVHRDTIVSGGEVSGGGSSVGGAIVGGLVAGGAGAVIGSRKKTEGKPITTKIVTNDERETFLNFFIDGKKRSMFFDYSGYNILLDILPERDFNSLNKNILVNKSNNDNKDNVINQIKQLAELRDEGILTEDEFQEKKKDLLSKI